MKDLLATCRSIVGHFKHSSVACHKLAHIQENLQLPKHKLKQDVVTRWNSTLHMLESILEQMALAAYAANNNVQHLTAKQLEMTRRMVLVLCPVEEITNGGNLKGNSDAVHCDTTHLTATEVLGETRR